MKAQEFFQWLSFSCIRKAFEHSPKAYQVSQWSRHENHDLQHHLVPVVASTFKNWTDNLNPKVVKATCTLINFFYKAQYPAHSESCLISMTQDLESYYSAVPVFIENGMWKERSFLNFAYPNTIIFATSQKMSKIMAWWTMDQARSLRCCMFQTAKWHTNQLVRRDTPLRFLTNFSILTLCTSLLQFSRVLV